MTKYLIFNVALVVCGIITAYLTWGTNPWLVLPWVAIFLLMNLKIGWKQVPIDNFILHLQNRGVTNNINIISKALDWPTAQTFTQALEVGAFVIRRSLENTDQTIQFLMPNGHSIVVVLQEKKEPKE